MTKTAAVGSWYGWQQRLAFVQMFLGVAMQTTYVAFPAYNFSLACWTAYLSTCKSSTRIWAVYLSVVPLSIITDIVWVTLWTSGGIFRDRQCTAGMTNILSCGGKDHFPGCQTNRFALAMLIFNIFAKAASTVCIYKILKQDTTPEKEKKWVDLTKKNAAVRDFPSNYDATSDNITQAVDATEYPVEYTESHTPTHYNDYPTQPSFPAETEYSQHQSTAEGYYEYYTPEPSSQYKGTE